VGQHTEIDFELSTVD